MPKTAEQKKTGGVVKWPLPRQGERWPLSSFQFAVKGFGVVGLAVLLVIPIFL